MIQRYLNTNEELNKLFYLFPKTKGDLDFFYDGTQLSSLFSYNVLSFPFIPDVDFQIGDSIIAFRGGAEVMEHMVDQEDLNNKDKISSKEMVHFIITMNGNDLEKAVAYQRLFIAIIKDYVDSHRAEHRDFFIERTGDDIYLAARKLSVSIATCSANQKLLIHTGINIDPGKDCPVLAIGLKELGIEPGAFARDIMDHFSEEVDSIRRATYKVRSVE